MADPKVAGRVREDQRDGIGLGVQGTPTFFFDGTEDPEPQFLQGVQGPHRGPAGRLTG
ncbi:DsbA family protein [Streptomyces sp. Lzd4kr]|nr:DsbA family protein [Streptomyces sp. Lzd4kr]